jgi:hypothetical protein
VSSGRITPVGGLTYLDANSGRLTTEGPDVCDIKARLRELDPGLSAAYDEVQEEWIITWWDPKRNQDTLILTCGDLAEGWDAIQRARNDRPGALSGDQMTTKLEKEQDADQEKDLDQFRETAGDAAERLMHALKQDGFYDHEDIYGVATKPTLSHKANQVRDRRPS